MIREPMDILTQYPVRKSKGQKQAFRTDVCGYAASLDYECREEAGGLGVRNLVIGDPEKAKVLITAHYDTCAALPFPNLITPCNFLPFLGCQLLQIFALLTASILLGILVGILTASVDIGYWCGYLGFWVFLVLMLIGPANKTNANDNTSGVVTLLEIARTLPENQREKTCFILFDLEEAGLLGSAAYQKAHKDETTHQLVLNLDCVGDGDHIRLFPTKRLKKDPGRLEFLRRICGYHGKKSIQLRESGFAVYPSDQRAFPYGVGICALRNSKAGLYLGRIHTKRDTILEQTNVNLLRAALTTFLCQEGKP